MEPIAIGIALLLCTVLDSGNAAEPKTYGVCEILEHLEQFRCRLVRVKARLESTVDTWLVEDDCRKHIEVDGLTFQNFIKVNWPTDPRLRCAVEFKEDEWSHRGIRDVLSDYDPGQERILVDVEGVIQTRDPPYALVVPDPPRRIGFGHEGAAPAQIIIKRVIDVRVVRKQPK